MAIKRILLVDDDFHLRRSLEVGLRSLGYSVTSAVDALEAMQLIENNVFDVVVSDVLMPGPSGLDLAEHVHAIKPKLPIILMTANNIWSSFRHRTVTEVICHGPSSPKTSTKKSSAGFPAPLIIKPFVLSELVNLFEPAVEV
jgi:DNA-binding NtrC family response regulator